MFDSRPTVAWPQPLSRDRSATFFKILPDRLKRPENVVWQSADGRVTSDHCRVTVQLLFSKFSQIARNVQKTLFDSRPTVAWPRPLSRDRSATFFKIFPNRLKRPKNVVWQSAYGRVTSTTVAWPFSDFFKILPNRLKRPKNVVWQSVDGPRDLRPLSRDRSATFFKIFPNRLKRLKNVVWQSADGRVTSTTVAWPFSDFFQNSPDRETSKKRCLTVGRRSRVLRPLSRDRSATFFKIFPNRSKRPKNVVWQSAYGRVTSDHCHVTVQRLFSKSSQIAWNVQKTLFDSRPTVAWPPTTVAWPFSDFFQNFPKSLEASKKRWLTVGRRSRDLNHCRVTVQRLFQNFPKSLETVQKRCLTVGRLSRDLRPLSRDRSATFFKKISNCLKRPKNVVWQSAYGRVTSTTVAWPFSDFFQNYPRSLERPENVVWQSADGRVTSDHCRVTVQLLFSNFPKSLETSKKRCLTVGLRSRDPPTTVTWPFSDFFQNLPKSLETSKKRCLTVGLRSRDLNHCRVTVQRLFSKFSQSLETSKKRCLTVGRRSRDLRPLSRDRSATFFKIFPNSLKRLKNVVWQSADGRVTSTTVAWPFSDFFKILPDRLKRPKNVVWQSADGRVTSDHCRVTVQRLFSKFSQIARNVQKTLFDSRPTVAWPPTTVTWPFSELFSKSSQIAWNVQKTLFDSRPTVAWPQPLSRDRSATFFQNSSKSLETSKKRCLTVGRRSRDLRPLSRDRSATFFKNFQIAWNVQKTLFDSRPTVAWPPTTVAWPFSVFFQNFPKSLETSKKRCLTVGRRSPDLRPLSRDRSATFFKIFPNRLKRPKNVVWHRPTVAWPPTTVAWPFSDFFQKFFSNRLERPKTLFDSRPTVAWPPTTVTWPFSDFFQNFPNRLKRPKNVVWQSAYGRVTSTTVAWPFSDFFQNSPKSLETSKKRCLTVGRRSRDLRPLSRDRSATFFKIFPNRLKRPKNVVWQSADGRVTSDHCRVTVQRLFQKNF